MKNHSLCQEQERKSKDSRMLIRFFSRLFFGLGIVIFTSNSVLSDSKTATDAGAASLNKPITVEALVAKKVDNQQPAAVNKTVNISLQTVNLSNNQKDKRRDKKPKVVRPKRSDLLQSAKQDAVGDPS